VPPTSLAKTFGLNGRVVPLCERIPDRSTDVLNIVLLRERIAAPVLERRRCREERIARFAQPRDLEPDRSEA
jgi:hypothetical protein